MNQPTEPAPVAAKNLTAFAAAVLAILSALLYAVITAIMLTAGGFGISWLALAIVVQVVAMVLLGAGGIRMLKRKRSGRTWVIAGCSLALLLALVGFVTAAAYRSRFAEHGYDIGPAITGSAVMSTVFYVLPTVATLALAVLPATRRWCTA